MYKHVQGRKPFLSPLTSSSSRVCFLSIEKMEVRNSQGFTIRYLVFSLVIVFLSIKNMGNNRRNNKLKKRDSIQEKVLKMALSFIVCTSKKISVFTSNRPARLMMFES